MWSGRQIVVGLFVAVVTTCAGCGGSKSATSSNAESLACDYSRTPLEDDREVLEGVRVAAVQLVLAPERLVQIAWEDLANSSPAAVSRSTLSLSFMRSGTPGQLAVSTSDQTWHCPSHIEMDGVINLTSADGAFNDAIATTVTAEALDRIGVNVALTGSVTIGSFRAPLAKQGWTSRGAFLLGTLGPKDEGNIVSSETKTFENGDSVLHKEVMARWGSDI